MKIIDQISDDNNLDLVKSIDPCPPLLVKLPLNAKHSFSCLAFI